MRREHFLVEGAQALTWYKFKCFVKAIVVIVAIPVFYFAGKGIVHAMMQAPAMLRGLF